MSISKQIGIFAVSIALIAAGGIIGMRPDDGYAGAGSGSNAKIDTLEELQNVLSDIGSPRRNIESVSAIAKTNEESEESVKYKTYTIVNTTDFYSSSEKSNNTFSRTMKIYFGENASMYESEARVISSSSSVSPSGASNSWSSERKSSLDMKVRIYVSEDCIMYNLSRLNYTYQYSYDSKDESYTKTTKDTNDGILYSVMQKYLGQWVDCSENPSCATGFLDIDNENRKGLSAFGTMIGEQLDDDKKNLKQTGNVYALKESALLQFFNLSRYKDEKGIKTGAECSIDLGTKTQPKIAYSLFVDVKETSENKNASYSYIKDSYAISNINNTVAKKPKAKTIDVQKIIDQAEELIDELN